MIYQKYQNFNTKIPQENRQSINKRMLEIVDNYDMTAQETIYNRYTGKGGLHGLERRNFSNYFQYSSRKKTIDNGQYFTGHDLCRFIVSCLRPGEADQVADLTCGMGNFFNFLNEKNVFGLEVDPEAVKVARYLYPEAKIEHGDLRFYHTNNTLI